ncbi:P-loop containing nucleoside triphosphate hydrolase protein [Mycena leptocephala]|nr:P-loop containing nucleoside triphosphate hydrolase protein [Mycena leptocephala]
MAAPVVASAPLQTYAAYAAAPPTNVAPPTYAPAPQSSHRVKGLCPAIPSLGIRWDDLGLVEKHQELLAAANTRKSGTARTDKDSLGIEWLGRTRNPCDLTFEDFHHKKFMVDNHMCLVHVLDTAGHGGNPIFILVGNKADKFDEREVSQHEGANLARSFGCEFFETSAKTAENVDKVLESLVRALRKSEGSQRKKKCIIL